MIVMGLLSELRRRNVDRMAVLYVVAAWLIVQVAEVLIGLGVVPASIGPAIFAVLVIGFPISLIISWYLEITPEGLKFEKDVKRADSITHVTGRRMDFMVIALLSAAVILFAYDKWWIGPPPEQSIAILPFENISPDDGGVGLFAIGVHDDLLTRLSKISALKVTSRTSVEQYRNTSKSIGRIGEELGVSRILEGSIQGIGNKIRINVQLIDAASDTHLWAETYDRELTASNLFGIQSEITETIARQLQANLTQYETEQLKAMPTANLAAYTSYLQGKQLADIESIESKYEAIKHFEAALELDPDFALAYVGLADAYLTLAANFLGGLSDKESIALAEPPLIRALALNPELAQAYATLGLLRFQQGDYAVAEGAFRKAIELQPNYSRAILRLGNLRWQQNQFEETRTLYEKALALDPYSVPANMRLARYHDTSGRFDEALDRYLRVVEIEPNHAFAYVHIAAIQYLVYGRVDESLAWYNKAAENDALSPSLQAVPALAFLEIGDVDSARLAVERGLELDPDTFWSVWASLLLNKYLGDDAAAQRDAQRLLDDNPRFWGALCLLRDADIAAGRYEIARLRYARSYRELTEAEVPLVDASNYVAAVDLALVLMRLGEKERADDLLEGGLTVIKTLPRHGQDGYWITDVRIFALQRRPERALTALRQAIDEGWRFLSWLYLEYDPSLESLRNQPEFQQLHAALSTDLAAQARHVQNLKASGDLSSIALIDE